MRDGSPRAYVRLIDAAVADVERIAATDAGVLRAVLKRLILLEIDPEAGEPLLGGLVGWRKLTVGDRRWRIVWRVSSAGEGLIEITIAEVWAIGARADGEVYGEMVERVAQLGSSPTTTALADVVNILGRHAQRAGVQPALEPTVDPVPSWLRVRLEHSVGMDESDIAALSGAAAMDVWERHISGPQM